MRFLPNAPQICTMALLRCNAMVGLGLQTRANSAAPMKAQSVNTS
jgi:hypothetical protein